MMKRRDFLNRSAGLAIGTLGGVQSFGQDPEPENDPAPSRKLTGSPIPLAITMWEFSWLERRWPGAGYEDWDLALSELVERGYDAVRIDAFPHLVFHDAGKEYLLLPHWSVQDWGSPSINRVRVQPHLNMFLEKCREHGIKAGLSSWFRKDEHDLRMKLDSPEKLGEAWLAVLDSIDAGGVLDTIFYVDLCNEWTGPAWCPFFVNDPPEAVWTGWDTEKSRAWMERATTLLKEKYPELPVTFSFTGEVTPATLQKGPFGMLDFLEPHIWMSGSNGDEYYREVGYAYDLFDGTSYRNLALNGKRVYESRKAYWQAGLREQIRLAAAWSEKLGTPLVTTECWGVVDFKDGPLLDWDYVKELCALGAGEAAASGRWAALATSNFCGPQFTGMWRDVEWHRRLTKLIHGSVMDQELENSALVTRLKETGAYNST
ncbi:MAG: cellulase-like family protein [Bacteroidales bacterium]